ncbi:ribosome maturation factor RimM [Parachryseolinea silvisoli]|uniref:ribosome maturation factor RimM n=1 Tax=Parachryseolinea silvisoli TaxID=2873601 RepID=UPI002265BB13|nr:ribosome maturation factor RimM [Parachryseolinea silvisoli]MCD9015907.1 ribosome maturation factor RimM [Parachryseolinea silvisoli]
MEFNDYFKIGYVLKPHGLKGEVTISLDEVGPEDLAGIGTLFLEKNNRLEPYFVESLSGAGSKAYLKVEDVDTPESAQSISKRSIYLPKAARPKSSRGQFYDDEVIDFEVTDAQLGAIGKVVEVMKAGANRLLVLDYYGKEVLIPVNSPFIKSINKGKKLIAVELPEGFLDI